MRAAVDQMVREGQLLGWGPPATGVLVQTLLERGTEMIGPKPRPRLSG